MHEKEVWATAFNTEHETAALLNVTVYALRKWRRDGSGPPYIRCGGRLIRYSPDDVAAWMNRNRFSSVSNEFSSKAIQKRRRRADPP